MTINDSLTDQSDCSLSNEELHFLIYQVVERWFINLESVALAPLIQEL